MPKAQAAARAGEARRVGPNAVLTLCGNDSLCVIYSPLAMACLVMLATDPSVIPRSLQYFDCNPTESCFFPLLALHPQQQEPCFLW